MKKAAEIHENITWKEITPGGVVCEPSTSTTFKTGDWRTMRPVFLADKCKQCALCVPVCPDNAIPFQDGKRGDFDLFFCKGCGICWKVCPFGAIDFIKDEK